MTESVSLSRFSFQIPKPLQENYVRKRPARPALENDADDLGIPGYLPTTEGNQSFSQPVCKDISVLKHHTNSQKVVIKLYEMVFV